jgi:hypothetical protein
MKKIKSTLFVALFVAVTATSTLAADGQIPIGGRPGFEPNKTTTATINTLNEPNDEIAFEISNYLWTFVSFINQFKF